jgi:glycosyltransferase involved in cell wall biosynthesis
VTNASRVAFNGRFLDQDLTGVQRYAHDMLATLGNRLQVVRPATALSPARGHLWEQATLPRRCEGLLLWSPGNTGPLACANQVVTLHDASTLDHPEWFSGKFAAWYRFLLPRLARRVRKIITVSEFSRTRLIERCDVNEDKIVAVPNAIDVRFQPIDEAAQAKFRRRHTLDRPYCLYVGSLEPRKNVATLLKAWALLGAEGCELVIAGSAGHVFRQLAHDAPTGRVRLFGRVEDGELPALLASASCFVFPSLYEGFGFPPLEAMACGCPVACSSATSLPEVCGPAFDPANPASTGAALYFDPLDAEEMAAALRTALEMPRETRARLVANGLARSRQFSLERCAAQTWAVLEELIGP